MKLLQIDLAIMLGDRLVMRSQELASAYVAYTDALQGKRVGAIDPLDHDDTAEELLRAFARFLLVERGVLAAVTTDLLGEQGLINELPMEDRDEDF